MCLASSEICVARNARASIDGAAIANGSSSVVTRSSPRKNDDRLQSMYSRSGPVQTSDSHSALSCVKSNDSEFQCCFSQRENSFRYEGAASTIRSSPAITLSMSPSSSTLSALSSSSWRSNAVGWSSVLTGAPSGRGGRPQLLTGRLVNSTPAACERPVEQLAGHLRRLGMREQIPLHQVAAQVPQRTQLLGTLDALRDDAQTQRLSQAHDGVDDRGLLGVAAQPVDERAVDLQVVEPEPLEVAERRVARPEVVD